MPSFNDIEKQRIKKVIGGFCQERIPNHQRSQVRPSYKVSGFEVKIIESRPVTPNNALWIDAPVAKLVYDPDTLLWLLYWLRGPGKWQKYTGLEPTNSLHVVVDEIAKDPDYVFWG